MNELIEKLNNLLATTFAFYLKAHFFHWNVKGQDFFQYHDFFGELYEDAFGAVDKTAEEIRALDGIAYGSLSQYQSLSTITDQTTVPALQEMVSILYRDNEAVLASLMDAHRTAEANNQRGLVNFLEDRIDHHKKHGWMLRASMSTPTQESVEVKQEEVSKPEEVKTYTLNLGTPEG